MVTVAGTMLAKDISGVMLVIFASCVTRPEVVGGRVGRVMPDNCDVPLTDPPRDPPEKPEADPVLPEGVLIREGAKLS
jgi:hypothetical protein